jgi:formylglycine-generating enzyme required for sulfatase activity
MVGKVFISYRRDDSRYQARMIYTAFTQVVPRDHVFMDIDSIPLGADFRKILKSWVNECDVLLALIGPGWIDARDPRTGQPRLMNPADFVRIETAEALARGIPVVPVMLDGAPMPDYAQLPDDLKELVYRHAEFVEYACFDDDVARLIRKLQPTAPKVAPATSTATPSRVDQYRAEGRIKVDAATINGAPDGWFKPGNGVTEWFKDHELGPEMVVVPAGSFTMGSPADEPERFGNEEQVKVTISRPFAVARFAVSFDEWDACAADGGCSGYMPEDEGWGRGKPPAINVSWDDAQAYVAWLSRKTGKTYRLLSEAEWEYVARAGKMTPFWWGSSITPAQANYDGSATPYKGGGAKGEYRWRTVPVDSFQPNPWGLYNVHGNVWEWTEDCWNDSNSGNSGNGSARTSGDCSRRVLRGGSWNGNPQLLRSANRLRYSSGYRVDSLGFRVGRTLTP